jgi:hypothetical protein
VPNLSNIPALDVFIGLAFVYFILSLVISSVSETISAVFNVRWTKLEQGLRELFLNADEKQDEATKAEANRLWSEFQNNPRIKALWKQTGRLGARGPSYIPPRVFALTLLDTLAPPLEGSPAAAGDAAPTDEQVAAAAQAAKEAKAAAAAAAANAAAHPSDAQAAAAAKAAADEATAKAAEAAAVTAAQAAAKAKAAADEAAANAAAHPSDAQAAAEAKAAADEAAARAAVVKAKQMTSDHDLVARAERAAGSVPNPLLRKWLLDALTEVGVDREKILKSLESSFDSVTNRVSGWYKRYATIVVAVLAIVAAGALNVDSYAIGSRLWKDAAVRSAIANQAANLNAAKCPQPTGKSSSGKGTGGNTGTSTTGTTGTTSTTGTATQPKLSLEQATKCVTALRALGLPIGWAKENRPNTAWGWAGKAFGMIVTAFALMLGAPFWFDTLSKLARLRTTGNPEGTAKSGTSTS